jgi:hypothetical protein
MTPYKLRMPQCTNTSKICILLQTAGKTNGKWSRLLNLECLCA